MAPIQQQMVFQCAEQWLGGLFYRVAPQGDGLCLDRDRGSAGVYCLRAVDSGEKGFSWRRAAVEADLPPNTALRVYAFSSDDRDWAAWEELGRTLESLDEDPGPLVREVFGPPVSDQEDFLLQRTGRYLWLAFELTTAGTQTPSIRRLRLWMAGDHMIDYLPAIYQSQDFTRRFLSIFDSLYADMERAIDDLPGRVDYEYVQGDMLRYLASWMCVDWEDDPDLLRARIRSALADHESLYTVEGVRRSVRRLTGREPILIEHFQVSPNRPECRDPEVYRRLYGEDPYSFFVLLPEDAFANQRERKEFQRQMEEVIPAGMTMRMIQLKQCVQLDWHTYLGINSTVGGYVPAAINEQVTIHYDTTIGGERNE